MAFLATTAGLILEFLWGEPLELAVAAFIWVLLVRAILSRPPMFVCVGPDGIAVCDRRRLDQERYAWNRVNGARMDRRATLVLRIDGADRCFDAWRGNVREAEECAECIDEHGS